MSKVSNVLLMLQYLENGRKYSIKELSDKLEVSERMIRVYKEDLEKAGIYIDTIKGPYGGYVLNQSVRIPPFRFKTEDYDFLKQIKVPFEKQEQYQNIINKVLSVSSDEVIEVKDDTKNYFNTLTKAIKEHRKVKILYYSYKHGDIERIIHPLDMFYYQSGWGCAAYCELRKDLRHFELKRIQSIELLEEKF